MELTSEEKELILSLRKQKAESKFKPKKASDFTVEEKIALFNKMLTSATEAYSDIMADDEDEDTVQYIYEEAMGWLGDGVWDAINGRGKENE